MSALDAIDVRAGEDALTVFGALHAALGDAVKGETIVLLGPREPGFWQTFTKSAEYTDGAADPLDRWSRRVIGRIATDLGARALFPFGGPPFQPFIQWAVDSGRAWQSPVGLLVHDEAGLMVSYRGALVFEERLDLPAHTDKPCKTCADQPCRTACPVEALTPDGYDIPACKAYIASHEGRACRETGCAVRRACPVSQGYSRKPAQSAFHMRAFSS